ncbi:MAG: hypothetical protein ACKVQS_12445 [Fimbriimonadaceae bacterium]
MNLYPSLFAQVVEESFWKRIPGPSLYGFLVLGLVLGGLLCVVLSRVPSNMRRWVIVSFTFLAGLPYVAAYLWPTPVAADFESELPRNSVEKVGFFLNQAMDPVGNITNIIQGFLLGVGFYSLVRIHLTKVKRKQENWGFSIVLLSCFVLMAVVGLWDWQMRTFVDKTGALNVRDNWTAVNYIQDFLFEGIYQQMDSAMFSMIAFFILSAAYRAFRVRSVEATVMMASALILMLNLMGALTFAQGNAVEGLAANSNNLFLMNLKINVFADWLRSTMQIPAIRAIDFGVGLGALAMGLRLWLGLEKGGVT